MGSHKNKKKYEESESSSSDSEDSSSSSDDSVKRKKHSKKSKHSSSEESENEKYVKSKRRKSSDSDTEVLKKRNKKNETEEKTYSSKHKEKEKEERQKEKSVHKTTHNTDRSRDGGTSTGKLKDEEYQSRRDYNKDKYDDKDRNRKDYNRQDERNRNRRDDFRQDNRRTFRDQRNTREYKDNDFRNRRDNNRHNNNRRRSSSFDHTNAKWGKQENTKSEKKEHQEKEKPNFKLTGKLTEETNTYRGVVVKYSEPPEARKPRRRWRLYPFKGEKALQTLYIHRESAYLIGRERKVVDLAVDHPSCSKQHAALQYRLVPFTRDDGSAGKRVRPYLIDLESANGTFINNKKIEARKYVELFEKDVIKFGFSSREYVLLHENSKDEGMDDDVKQEEEEAPVKSEPA